MNRNITPYRPEPFDEDRVEDILEEMRACEQDENVRHSRDAWREALIDCGYSQPHVEQVLDRWFVRCSTCGQDATHLWASVDGSGDISSIMGNGKFSPSCEDCTGSPAGDIPQFGVVRVPLDFDPTATTEYFALRFDDHPERVAEWLCNRQSDTLAQVLLAMDAGYAREVLTIAMAKLADQFDCGAVTSAASKAVLLDLVVDAYARTVR